MYVAVIEPHPALLGPFAILLLSIAIFPLILRRHWERHYQKLCALLATTTCGYYVFALHGAARVQHAAGEYATFIVVVGAFFVVAGAIHLHIPATRLAACKCHLPVRRKHPGKFYRHDWRVDAFASSLSAHEPRPW
jgi:hypothetical protein